MKPTCDIHSCGTLQNGAVLSGGSFCLMPERAEVGTNGKNKKEHSLGKPRTTGQSWQMLLSDGKVRPYGFGKNHPHCVPVFSPKTLPYRKHPPLSPRSSTGCQSPNIHK